MTSRFSLNSFLDDITGRINSSTGKEKAQNAATEKIANAKAGSSSEVDSQPKTATQSTIAANGKLSSQKETTNSPVKQKAAPATKEKGKEKPAAKTNAKPSKEPAKKKAPEPKAKTSNRKRNKFIDDEAEADDDDGDDDGDDDDEDDDMSGLSDFVVSDDEGDEEDGEDDDEDDEEDDEEADDEDAEDDDDKESDEEVSPKKSVQRKKPTETKKAPTSKKSAASKKTSAKEPKKVPEKKQPSKKATPEPKKPAPVKKTQKKTRTIESDDDDSDKEPERNTQKDVENDAEDSEADESMDVEQPEPSNSKKRTKNSSGKGSRRKAIKWQTDDDKVVIDGPDSSYNKMLSYYLNNCVAETHKLNPNLSDSAFLKGVFRTVRNVTYSASNTGFVTLNTRRINKVSELFTEKSNQAKLLASFRYNIHHLHASAALAEVVSTIVVPESAVKNEINKFIILLKAWQTSDEDMCIEHNGYLMSGQAFVPFLLLLLKQCTDGKIALPLQIVQWIKNINSVNEMSPKVVPDMMIIVLHRFFSVIFDSGVDSLQGRIFDKYFNNVVSGSKKKKVDVFRILKKSTQNVMQSYVKSMAFDTYAKEAGLKAGLLGDIKKNIQNEVKQTLYKPRTPAASKAAAAKDDEDEDDNETQKEKTTTEKEPKFTETFKPWHEQVLRLYFTMHFFLRDNCELTKFDADSDYLDVFEKQFLDLLNTTNVDEKVHSFFVSLIVSNILHVVF